MAIYHKHHIVPRHMGGTDDPSNLISVTVEQHANLHKQLWEDLGYEEDKIAWLCLSGQMSMDEASRLTIVEGRRKCYNMRLGIHSPDFDSGAATRDTKWIRRDNDVKRVKNNEIKDYIKNGWQLGKYNKKRKYVPTYEQLYNDYIIKNLARKTLAKKYNISLSLLKQYLNKMNIHKNSVKKYE